MHDFTTQLDRAVRAVAPIEGVAVGRRDDPSSWSVTFKPDATPKHKAAAEAILASFSAGPAQTDIDHLKARYRSKVDNEWLAARNRILTPGADGEYAEAVREASRYVATAGAGIYPMLSASVACGEAADLASAAALIAAKDAEWVATAAELRRLRLTAKQAIDQAKTPHDIESAAAVAWPV